MGLAEAKADIKIAAEQIATATTFEELKAQLLDNLLPAIEGVAQAANDELAARDEVIQTLVEDVEELIDDRGDILQPETATKVLSLFELGSTLGKLLEESLKGSSNELLKKKSTQAIRQYSQGVIVMTEYIGEITIPIEEEEEEEAAPASPPVGVGTTEGGDDDDDDDDEDDDDDDDDDEEDDEDEDEQAAKPSRPGRRG